MGINLFNLQAQYASLVPEVEQRIYDLLKDTAFVGGAPLANFEEHFAYYHSIKHCVGVGSGTDALWLSLLALGIKPGDEVIVPSQTFIATAFAASHVGAKVVFIDADPKSYNMDLEQLDSLITNKTRAIMPVHLYGNPCDIERIKQIIGDRDIKIIEDCAQATGAKLRGRFVGTIGDVGCFSFYPSKNLGGLGQGGAVITNDDAVAKKVRELGNVARVEGSHFDFNDVGFNSRLDSINAVFLDRCLLDLTHWNIKRILLSHVYNENLSSFGGLITPFVEEGSRHVYHLYQIKCLDKGMRDGLKNYLNQKDIGAGVYYPIPCHKQPIYDVEGFSLPVTEKLSETLLALPLNPALTEEEVQYICKEVRKFIKRWWE